MPQTHSTSFVSRDHFCLQLSSQEDQEVPQQDQPCRPTINLSSKRNAESEALIEQACFE